MRERVCDEDEEVTPHTGVWIETRLLYSAFLYNGTVTPAYGGVD